MATQPREVRLALVADDGDGARVPSRSWRDRLRPAAMVAAVVSCFVAWWWWSGSEMRAVRRMPLDQRRALYQRTLENVREVCTAQRSPLDEFCREQGTLLVYFPECDESCQVLARHATGNGRPTR